MNKIQKTIFINSFSTFSSKKLLEKIPIEILNDIKKKDPHPYFRAYTIAHEGISTPKILDSESLPIHWSRQAISTIKDVIKRGVQFFHGHPADDIKVRTPVGEVIHAFDHEENGILNSVVVGYFKDKEKIKSFDVCSMEAFCTMVKQAGKFIAEKIDSLTAVALANGKDESPAWSGARVLAEMQCFEKDGQEMPEKEINFYEVQKWIKDHNVWPSQLYNADSILQDRDFNKILVKADGTAQKSLEEKDLELKKLLDENQKLKIDVQKTTAKDRVASLIKEKKLTDKEKEFIEIGLKKLSKFEDADLEEFITSQQEHYKDVVKILMPTEESISVEENQQTKSDDYTKASNNPLLEEDV